MEFEYNKAEDQVAEAPVEAPVAEEVVPAVEEVPVVEQPKKKVKSGTVAIYSPKKVSMDGVVSLIVGVNHISKDDADKWLAAKYYLKLVEETTN